MVQNGQTKALFPLNYFCKSRSCLKCKVDIIELNGNICKITSRYATGSKYINRSTYSYDSKSIDNIPFLSSTNCGSAYLNIKFQIKTNIFANGFIDLLPHLENFLVSIGWTTVDIYHYRTTADSPYVAFDDPATDAQFGGLDFDSDDDAMDTTDAHGAGGGDDDDDDDDGDGSDNYDPIEILKNPDYKKAYAVITLGEVLKQNFTHLAQQNASNSHFYDKRNSFNYALVRITEVHIERLTNRIKNNDRDYIQFLKTAKALKFHTTSPRKCEICDEFDTRNFVSFTIDDIDAIVAVCDLCKNPIEAYFITKSLEKQVQKIAGNFALMLPMPAPQTKRNIMNEMISIMKRTNYFAQVNCFHLKIKTEKNMNTLKVINLESI